MAGVDYIVFTGPANIRKPSQKNSDFFGKVPNGGYSKFFLAYLPISYLDGSNQNFILEQRGVYQFLYSKIFPYLIPLMILKQVGGGLQYKYFFKQIPGFRGSFP